MEKTMAAGDRMSNFGEERAGSAVALVVGGVAAAFGAASCCALPMALGALGVGGIGLGGLALVLGPYREILMVAAALCVGAGGALLYRRAARAPGAPRGRRLVERLALAGFLVAAALIGLSLVYA